MGTCLGACLSALKSALQCSEAPGEGSRHQPSSWLVALVMHGTSCFCFRSRYLGVSKPAYIYPPGEHTARRDCPPQGVCSARERGSAESKRVLEQIPTCLGSWVPPASGQQRHRRGGWTGHPSGRGSGPLAAGQVLVACPQHSNGAVAGPPDLRPSPNHSHARGLWVKHLRIQGAVLLGAAPSPRIPHLTQGLRCTCPRPTTR